MAHSRIPRGTRVRISASVTDFNGAGVAEGVITHDYLGRVGEQRYVVHLDGGNWYHFLVHELEVLDPDVGFISAGVHAPQEGNPVEGNVQPKIFTEGQLHDAVNTAITDYKDQVREVAMREAVKHSWCEVVEEMLTELGIEQGHYQIAAQVIVAYNTIIELDHDARIRLNRDGVGFLTRCLAARDLIVRPGVSGIKMMSSLEDRTTEVEGVDPADIHFGDWETLA